MENIKHWENNKDKIRELSKKSDLISFCPEHLFNDFSKWCNNNNIKMSRYE